MTWPFLSTESSMVRVVRQLGKMIIPLCVPTLIEVAHTLLRQWRIVAGELYSRLVHRWLAFIAMIGRFTKKLGLHLQASVP